MGPARWFCSRIDRLIDTTRRWPGTVHPAPHHDVALTRDLIVQEFDRLTDDVLLRPRYTASNIDWIWHQMGRLADSAGIQRRAVVDSDQRLLGWYVYQIVPHDIGRVIHFAASAEHRNEVFQQLLADADAQSLAGLTGRVPAGMSAQELMQHRCLVSTSESRCMIHTRDSEIRDAFQQGDVFLSAVEGEECLNLGLRTADLPPVVDQASQQADTGGTDHDVAARETAVAVQ